MSLFADDMILYIEKHKVFTRKLLEVTSEFSKDSGYKINIQKFVAFLYTNNELSEREIKKKIPFKITSRDFLGGLVVETPSFHCSGCRFDPWSGN